jgi:hypothetical protein
MSGGHDHGNIECILAEVNKLSDSNLKIFVNEIMDRLKQKKTLASPGKVILRIECPVCHTNTHVVRNSHYHFCIYEQKWHFIIG